jgi:hypothetical protein
MSWLADLEREFKYACEECGKTSTYLLKQHGYDYTLPQKCVSCGSQAEYIGFKPIKLGMRSKVAFEHNGRKGFLHTDGKGGVRYTSASREHYLETGDIKPCYTDGYREHLVKTNQSHLLKEVSRNEIIEDRKKNKEISKLATPVVAIPADVD